MVQEANYTTSYFRITEMATLEQIRELFMEQEEKRRKEKEEEEEARKRDKEEMKEVIRNQMSVIKDDIQEVKMKQNNMETKMETMEKKLKELDDKAKKSEVGGPKEAWPTLQPENRTQTKLQKNFQPGGSAMVPCQQAGGSSDHQQVYSLVRQARRTVGFSPITDIHLKEMMEVMKTVDEKVGMVEVVREFLKEEMAIPEEVMAKLEMSKIFRRAGRQEEDKLYVEFEEDNMSGLVYKYARKLRRECNIHTYIPEAFRERAAELEKVAYELRHSTPSYNTKIRWGASDLLLERRERGSQRQYRTVMVRDLPPVDMAATPREVVTTPTSSPAPGRKDRKKRARSEESSNKSPEHKKQDGSKTPEDRAAARRLDGGFYSAMEFVTPKGSSRALSTSQLDFQ